MPAEAGAAPALHTVGSRVWMADPDGNGWLKAEVSNLGAGGTLTVKLEDGTEKTCTQDEIPLQNPGKNGVEVRLPQPRGAWQRGLWLPVCRLLQAWCRAVRLGGALDKATIGTVVCRT